MGKRIPLWLNARLCHKASESGDGEGAILPTWTHVDNTNVKTSRELWGYMKAEGWNVDVSFQFSKIIIG